MPTNGSEDGAVRQHLNLAANSLIDRSSLMQSLLGGSRDIDRDCNYPKGVVPRELYQELYDREPIAARVVEVYPKECWQVQPSVYEDEDSETETTFEKAWADLATSIRAEKSYHQDEQGSVLWEYLYRADVLSGIGHYGIILLGIDDGKDLSEPADLVVDSVSDEVTLAPEGTPWTPLPGTPEAGPIGETGPRLGSRGTGASGSAATDYNQGARTKGFANGKNRTWSWNQGNGKGGPKRKLTFLRVFPESMAWIDQFDSNPASPRFGQPVRYTLLFNDPAAQAAGVGLQMITAPVHWTRVIHVADNLASSEVFGLPRMQAVLNRLLDIRKIHGGSAEMYWRGAFPGYALETLPQLGTEVDIDQEGVKKMMWDWANGLQRHVVLTGLTMKSLSPQVTDPSPQVNTQIEAICIKIGVPVRIFKGSERGELASSQDDAAWNDRLKQRQAGYVTPRLVVPFVDRLIALGVLPAPEGYSVWWPDLTSKSDQEKAAIASQRTTALVAYGSSPPTQDIITPTDYLIKVQGFDEAEAQSIVENAQTEKDKREKEQAKQQQEQADAEHQRQLELATAAAPQQPPPDEGGDGGDGSPGTQSVPPSGPVDSPGGSSITNSGVTHNYDPSQPRDEGGKWSGAGGSRPTGERPSVSVVSREETNSTGRKVVFFHVAEDEKSRIKAFVTPEALRIKSTFVSDSRRGKGWGTALYEEAARYAASKGLRLESDEFVSADAVRVWDALARRGYKVTRHQATPDSEGGFNAVQDKGPVFSVPPGAVTHNYDSASPGESDGAVIDGVGGSQITPDNIYNEWADSSDSWEASETMNEEALGILFPPGDSAVEGELDLGLVLNWDSNWQAVQALIENISEDRGASPEEARRLEGILSSVDITTLKPLCATLYVNDSQPAPIGAVTVLPPVIANYLAYSTARNPSATLMAARDLVRDTASKVVGWRDPASELVAQEFHPTTIFDPDLGFVLNVTKEWQLEVVSNLHDTLKDHGYSNWYIALISAALDETNDVVRAVELANEAFDERDEDPEPDPQIGVENYDPSQSRDKSGRWVAGGGSIEREEWGHSQGDTFHAVIGGERVGSAKLFEDYSHSAQERWGSSAYYVSGLHVDESHRRRGAATAIYRAILEHISPSYLVPEFSRMPGGAALWDSLVKLPDVEVKRVEHEGLVQVGIRKRQPSSTTNYDLSQVHSRTAGGADFADLDNVLDNLATNAVTGPNPWAPYVGPRGGRGWKNSMTGRVFYGARQPGLGRGHVPVVPGAASPGAPAPVAPAPAAVAGKPKAQPASPASVKAHIARLLTNPSQITAAHIHDVKEELLSMNIAQIHSVKRDLGLGASGPKATLAAKIAQKALAGLGKAQPKPPTPAPTPPQHQASAPAQRPTPAATPLHQASTPTPAQHQPTAPAAVPAHTTGTSAPSPLHKGANVITGAPAQAPPAPSHLPVVPHKDEIEWSTGKPQPGTLHGVDFAPAPHHFWEHVKDKDVGEPPPTRPIRRAGVMIQEPDGRIWIVKPTNEFGDRTYTLPGGGVEKGLTHQQNALKEVWEETGLQVEITGHLGDFRDSNNKNIGRLYIGKRVGGAPWDAKIEPHIIDRKTGKPGAESSEVVLVTPERARKLLHRTDDLAQLMTVAPPPVGTATRGKGSQALIKFVEAIQPATKDFLNKGKATGSTKPGNGELHAVQEIRGFNEKPKVVSKKDMDTLLAGGDHIEMLRGLGSFGSTSAKDLAQQFREGDHYPGFGCFGSGTYADSTKGYSNAASGYASSYSRDSAMLRIALPKTARIIKQSELEKKVPINPEDFKGYQNTQGGYSAREEWHGVQAALAGYDAIEVDGKSNHHHSYGKGYYVILNRSVLTVQKEDAKGHMIS